MRRKRTLLHVDFFANALSKKLKFLANVMNSLTMGYQWIAIRVISVPRPKFLLIVESIYVNI